MSITALLRGERITARPSPKTLRALRGDGLDGSTELDGSGMSSLVPDIEIALAAIVGGELLSSESMTNDAGLMSTMCSVAESPEKLLSMNRPFLPSEGGSEPCMISSDEQRAGGEYRDKFNLFCFSEGAMSVASSFDGMLNFLSRNRAILPLIAAALTVQLACGTVRTAAYGHQTAF